MNYPTVTVTALNAYIKDVFDGNPALKSVVVSGEISNFGVHRASGHAYFTLKDDASAIKAVMFRADGARLKFRPENGMKVLAFGRVGVYERDGVYQLYVTEMIPDGVGALQLAFEQLKERLAKEGLFDEAHKKPLPAFPKRIGVITSPTGAVRRDIENVTRRRYPYVELVLWGATVQGPTAPGEIVSAIRWFNRKKNVDLLIVARGGGSMEDLWCFNDETLARAIYESELPVISAVGHETDFTICDFVADRRAPTPSAAAEIAVPDAADLRQALIRQSNALLSSYRRFVSDRRASFAVLSAKRDFTDISGYFSEERERIGRLSLTLGRLAERRVGEENARFAAVSARLPRAVEKDMLARSSALGPMARRLDAAALNSLRTERTRLENGVAALRQLNPLNVLLRGFAVVEAEGRIRSSVKDLSPGARVTAVFADGRAECLVESTEEGEPFRRQAPEPPRKDESE